MENGPFAAEQGTRLLERLAYQAHATIRRRDAEAVHDLRVAIRRLVQVVTVFKPCFAPKASRKIRRRLKELMECAGEVRNCDIALQFLIRPRWSDHATLRQPMEARRKEFEQALAGALKQWVARKTSSKWRTALEAGPASAGFWHRAVTDTARREMTRMARDFFESGNDAVEAKASGEELHRLRLAAKKLRYTLELFAGVYGPASGTWLEQIREVQTLLGAVNDCRTVRSLVSGMEGTREFEAALKRRQRRKTLEFRQAWREQFSPAVARQWTSAMRHPQGLPVRKPVGRSQAARSAPGLAAQA